MENCLYQGNNICTYELKDDNGLYFEDMVLDLKQAAAGRLLTCPECKAPVYLAAGPVKEPYFAHYDLKSCDYGNSQETEELKKGKRLLYQLMKRSFPDSDILARHRMENGMYSTIYCEYNEDLKLAIDYRLQNSSLESFQMRDGFYQSNRIRPIYVLGIRQKKDTGQIDWYQNLIQSSMGYLIFLDVQKESISLKKCFGYRIGRERYFKFLEKAYQVKELKFDKEGQMLCDFFSACEQAEWQIREEIRQYDERKQLLQSLKNEQQRLRERDKKRLEEYRSSMKMPVKQADKPVLDPVILEKCRKLISEGNSHLVSKKYYDALISELE